MGSFRVATKYGSGVGGRRREGKKRGLTNIPNIPNIREIEIDCSCIIASSFDSFSTTDREG